MKRKFRISRKKRKLIEEAVATAETKTCGEIVPMIVNASHDYWWVHWYWAGVFTIIVSATLWWASSDTSWALMTHQWLKNKTDYSFWGISIQATMIFQACAALFGFAIGFLEPMKRMIVPRKWAAHQVHRSAMANFLAHGLTETRDRTGVLIYISHLEHQVEIIADKGISDRLPEDFWKEQADAIIQGIHRGKAAEALIYVINEIGEKLSLNFPKRADDTNELSNRLRTGHGDFDPPRTVRRQPEPTAPPVAEPPQPPTKEIGLPPPDPDPPSTETTGESSLPPTETSGATAPPAPIAPHGMPKSTEEGSAPKPEPLPPSPMPTADAEDTGSSDLWENEKTDMSAGPVPNLPSPPGGAPTPPLDVELDDQTNTNTEIGVPPKKPSDLPPIKDSVDDPTGDTDSLPPLNPNFPNKKK